MPVPAPNETFTATMTDGLAVPIRRYGRPGGTRLVVSHGNGFAVDGYRVFWEPLTERFDVLVFDMRNHGRTEPTGADGHHYEQMAKDIESVASEVEAALGKAPTVGVFHSMSSRAAMKQAVERGSPWDALVLFDPPNVPPRDHPLYEAMRVFELRLLEFAANRPDRFASVGELAGLFRGNKASSRWDEQAKDDMAEAVLRPRPNGEGYELVCRRELEASIYLAALTLDLWPKASEFGGPMKMIGADHELVPNTATAKANHALATENGYEYEAVPKTGHLLQIEQPEACRAAMLSFLEKLKLA
ncbi:alpha/beta fold hydrolase [Propylenella binzhouense]|uniref:Alpha/beta hydrolase n=1 Tax=Propylenella binzhouense TaxID=2555902 RepID=A0A964WSS5_9HYPH|nr:alpha/beta hydrolase [Propylenella binzhouense]MYZ47105.1 alpha/beta hydrolase [Propylenella binzhouense]